MWLVMAAAMLWGTTGTAQAFAPDGAQSQVIGTLRLVIGGLGLLLLARRQGTLPNPLHWPRVPLIITAVAIAAYQVCFFAGVGRTGVAVGTIVGIGSAPIFAGLLDITVNRVKLSRRWLISTGLAICGCALLVLSGGDVGVDPLGIILSMGAGLSYAIYALGSKSLLLDRPPDAVMAVVFCAGALILSPLLLTAPLDWLFTVRGVLVVLHLGLLATALSYAFFARGLNRVTASVAVTLSLAEPLTAGLLGVLLLGETLTATAVGGIVLLFAGLMYLVTR